MMLAPLGRSSILLLALPTAICLLYILPSMFPDAKIYLKLQTSQSFQSTEATNNVAVIIEDRPLSNLAPLLLHFSSILGKKWPIILVGPENILPNSTWIRRAIEEHHITVRSLPDDVSFDNHQAVTEFLTQPWLWEQLAPVENILLFQADSILCSNSDTRIEDFLQYDFVGAPIDAKYGKGYNGGLSLRKRSKMLEIVTSHNWTAENEQGGLDCMTGTCVQFEDQWFYHKLKLMPNTQLPSMEIASTFAVETIWYDRPLGYHQVERWQSARLEEIEGWCPEYKLTTTELLINHQKPPALMQEQHI